MIRVSIDINAGLAVNLFKQKNNDKIFLANHKLIPLNAPNIALLSTVYAKKSFTWCLSVVPCLELLTCEFECMGF